MLVKREYDNLSEEQMQNIIDFLGYYASDMIQLDKPLAEFIKDASVEELTAFNSQYLMDSFTVNTENIEQTRESFLGMFKEYAVMMYAMGEIDVDKSFINALELKKEDFEVETPFFEKTEADFINQNEAVQKLIEEMNKIKDNKDLDAQTKDFQDIIDSIAKMQERTNEILRKMEEMQKRVNAMEQMEKNPEELEKVGFLKRFVDAIKRYFASFNKELDEVSKEQAKEAEQTLEESKSIDEKEKGEFFLKKMKDSVLLKVMPNLIEKDRMIAEKCTEFAKQIDDIQLKNETLTYELKNAFRKYKGMSEIEFEKKNDTILSRTLKEKAEKSRQRMEAREKVVDDIILGREGGKTLDDFKTLSSISTNVFDMTGFRENIDEKVSDDKIFNLGKDTHTPMAITFDREQGVFAIHLNQDWRWDKDSRINEIKRDSIINDLNATVFGGKARTFAKGVYFEQDKPFTSKEIENFVKQSVALNSHELYVNTSKELTEKKDALIKDAVKNNSLQYFSKKVLREMIKENPSLIRHIKPNPLDNRYVVRLQDLAIQSSPISKIPHIMEQIEKSGYTTDKIRTMACSRNYLSLCSIPNPSDKVKEVASKKIMWNEKPSDKQKDMQKDKSKDKDVEKEI